MREIMQTPEFKNLTNKKDLFTIGETSLFVQNAQLRSIWCKIVDAFQTSVINAHNDYKLKHLVEVFNLSGNLIHR